jgi:primosomal protein N' (replication factor Y)
MKERDEFTRHPMLSNTLLKEIGDALQRSEQSLVYLNRRGTARVILCSSCGWQAMCPTCDIALTYHHDAHQLRCHTCGYHEATPTACPVCKSTDIVFKSAGTKALADWLQKHFPSAKVGRFDTDNLLKESLAERHEEVASGAIDILVGTQMLVKGLDLPHLSVVGIVAADLSLQIPDFSAEERTYQLLRQAIGRVGRGHTHGTTVIQTFNPENQVIQQAVSKNYDEFYTTQIEQRKVFQFSPMMNIATFWCSRRTAASALEAANKVLMHLKKNSKNCTFLGPVLTFHPRRRGYQSAQIVVKSSARSEIALLAALLPSGWQYDLEPINLL